MRNANIIPAKPIKVWIIPIEVAKMFFISILLTT
jgi:hypothetical protein